MKNLLLFWILLAIGIIIMSMNGWQLMPGTPVPLPDSALGQALFVCPAAHSEFDDIAAQIFSVRHIIYTVFIFFGLLWLSITGWTLYQALLKDKFVKKSFELPIFFGKSLLFAFVLITILMWGPNSFRTVTVRGSDAKWVLCQSDSPGARAVRKEAVFGAGKISY